MQDSPNTPDDKTQLPHAVVSLEHLYHYRCGACDAWWSIADRHPKLGTHVFCPECGAKNLILHIEFAITNEECSS
ncbi:MAG: hypothetical protein B0A82_14645 [Alkalinema sp. CACIAM 70d]|nr:MAG: hypothetical protein B0A82_14645 [Alkalinema sp. CACIAM 70d]